MNVINEYLKILNDDTTNLFRITLEKFFKRKISDEFITSYINARYYPEDEKSITKTKIKAAISDAITSTEKKLYKEYEGKENIIKQNAVLTEYIQYIDYFIKPETREYMSLLKKCESNPEFLKELEKVKEEHQKKVETYLDKFESNDFYLKFEKCPKKNNVDFVELEHDINLSILYSKYAKEMAFNTGKTREDKYLVAYHMLAKEVIRDILNERFNKEYIIEFPETVLDKKQKLKNLLGILQNELAQDKICLKIPYEGFVKNKKDFNQMIKSGFKIAIVLDRKVTINEIMKMEIFKYIIVKKELRYKSELLRHNKKLNIIEQ